MAILPTETILSEFRFGQRKQCGRRHRNVSICIVLFPRVWKLHNAFFLRIRFHFYYLSDLFRWSRKFAPIWDIALSASSLSQYSFSSLSSNYTSDLVGFSLNLTHSCSNSTSFDSADADKYLYAGGLIAPFNGNHSTIQDYPWADSIPYPSMTGQFDKSTAHLDMVGLFDLNTLSGTTVGSASRSLDAVRSDQLLLGEASPEWNATLGFSEKNVISNTANSGYGALRRILWVYLGLMLLCML